jgi:hypothetical protein
MICLGETKKRDEWERAEIRCVSLVVGCLMERIDRPDARERHGSVTWRESDSREKNTQ